MVAMNCPAIPFTAAEVRREAYLWRLAGAFQALMDQARNPCALKGGTALRFQVGPSRPSTDLDFEGDGPVSVRKTLLKAVAAATPPQPYRIGRDLLWRGTVTMTLGDAEAGRIRIGVDYRKTGSRSGMPRKVPLDRCERVQGINIYRPSELISRKLHTIVGERPRQKARDIYDAAWIVAEHPDLLGKTDAAKLRQWLEKMTPETREELQNRLRGEQLTSRVSAKEVWQALEAGIQRLEQRSDDPAPAEERRPGGPPPPTLRSSALRALEKSQRAPKPDRTRNH
jgi:predicted nucleotidyltransferase component of viral defense system